MTIPEQYSFTRYLQAKKTVDDRALNRHVLEKLSKNLAPSSQASPLKVLEIGSGIGTMLARLLEWELLNHALYTAIDLDDANIAYSKQFLSEWAVQHELHFKEKGKHTINLRQGEKHIQVELEAIDLMEFISREVPSRKWDLVIAHAFLDLVDISMVVPSLLELLTHQGLFYFTLVFDGITILEPAIQPDFDCQIVSLYHQSMDMRMINDLPSGSSRSGRELLHNLIKTGSSILSAGSSDWVVYAQDGKYCSDEAYFLHYIVHTIHEELKDHPNLDPYEFKTWVNQRHSQIERGELVFIAHQLDVLGRNKHKK
jgi:SAM-dependent methyltransferase